MAHRLQPFLDKILTAVYTQNRGLMEVSYKELKVAADLAYREYPEFIRRAERVERSGAQVSPAAIEKTYNKYKLR